MPDQVEFKVKLAMTIAKHLSKLVPLAYLAAVLTPATLAMLGPQAGDGESPLYQAGRCCALTAITILSLQVLLSGRFKVLERFFGLDVMVRFHRRMAAAAMVLFLLHPVLLALGGEGLKLLYSLDLPWYIWMAKAGAGLLVLNGFLSLLQRPFKLSFERWRFLHDLLGPAGLAAVFTHSWFVERGFAGQALSRLWPVMAGGFCLLFAWHRFARPALAAMRPYTVSAVRLEAPGVWTLIMTPPPGAKVFSYLPGQFQFLTLKRGRGLPNQEHHFTISSSPGQRRYVSSTIKELGDFTATIGRTAKGDKVAVDGPYGRFSYLLHPEDQDLVFLAAGIGITPLMSMLRHMRDTRSDLPVHLIYANRGPLDMAFGHELEAIASGKHPKLRVTHVLSSPEPGWPGETGHVGEGLLKRVLGDDLTGKSFYVSGPPGLVAECLKVLKRLQVPSWRIRREMFSLLD